MPFWALVGLALAMLVACAPSQSQDEAGAQPAPSASSLPPAPAAAASVAAVPVQTLSDDGAVELVNAAVKKHQLTALSESCLNYRVDHADAATVDVDVHEKHDATCGGDPETSPRLFSFRVDRASHRLSTDALDLADGEFKPIE